MRVELPGALLGMWVIGCGMVAPAAAQVDPAEVSERLGIMSRHVRAKKLSVVPLARLGQSARERLGIADRFYKPGDAWTVRFTPAGDPGSAESGGPAREPVLYDFKVERLESDGSACISVRQRAADAGWRADPRVDHVELVMARSFVPIRKRVYYGDGRAPLEIVLDSRGPAALGFSAAPIDLPNLGTDDGTAVEEGDGRLTLRFLSHDVYARPVEALWRQGELWPAVVKTPAGVAAVEVRK